MELNIIRKRWIKVIIPEEIPVDAKEWLENHTFDLVITDPQQGRVNRSHNQRYILFADSRDASFYKLAWC